MPVGRFTQVWANEYVVVYGSGERKIFGKLEDMGPNGVMLRQRSYVSWPAGPEVEDEEGEHRVVSVFHPWHWVEGMRLAEQEEIHGYALDEDF